jgi:predicted peptidase
MTIKVEFQREVLPDGDYVTSAILNSDKKVDLNDVKFTIHGVKIDIKKIAGNKFYFGQNEKLATIHFGSNFQDHFVLPEISVHINDLDDNIISEFKEDPIAEKFTTNFYHGKETLSYYLYTSQSKSKKRPMVVFLHGSGERGYGDRYPLWGNDVAEQIVRYVKSHEDAVVVAPQATWRKELNGWFRKGVRKTLINLINYLIKTENIDQKRIYLLGLSNGGAGTWHFAENHPDMFAAIAPCCGYIYNDEKYFLEAPGKGRYMEPTENEAKELKDMPIWAFAAADDNVVNPDGTRHTVKAIKEAGNKKIRETIYDAGMLGNNPHNSWKLAYHEQDLFPWMFKQKK